MKIEVPEHKIGSDEVSFTDPSSRWMKFLDFVTDHWKKGEISPEYVRTISHIFINTITGAKDDKWDLDFSVKQSVTEARVFAIMSNDMFNSELTGSIMGEKKNYLHPIPFENCIIIPNNPYSIQQDEDEYVIFMMFLLNRNSSKLIACGVHIFGVDKGIPGYPVFVVFSPEDNANFLRSLISQKSKLVVPTAGERLRHKIKTKSKKAPTPFYTITIDQKPVSEITKARFQNSLNIEFQKHLEWRHDRSAHQRLYVERGPSDSLDQEYEKKLYERGYTIYLPGDELGPSALEHLAQRGHALKACDEWVALRVVSVKETVVGPKDAPYFPAIRKP